MSYPRTYKMCCFAHGAQSPIYSLIMYHSLKCLLATLSAARPLQVHTMALSAEPGRKRAYDRDLRWRIVYQRIAMKLKFVEIATNLNIAISTAHRTYKLFEQEILMLFPRKGMIQHREKNKSF